MKSIRLFLITAFSILAFIDTSVAEKVTREKALNVASEFFSKSTGKHVSQNLKILRTSDDFPKFATKSINNTNPYLYVISGENDEGFVIVSGSDCAKPILGYSLTGTIDPDNIPDNVQYWLNFLSSQIKWAIENNISSTVTQQEWTNITKASSPTKYLETASWNQGSPYNLQCPVINGTTCVTGCVATAIAEVMRYHQWPKSGTGSTSAYSYEYNNDKITIPSRNLNHEYLWDDMPLLTKDYTNETQRNAVATLMADIGAACQLNYTPNSTGGAALNSYLVENFGYSPNLTEERRNTYSDETWIKLLKSELDQNRPLAYSGQDEENGGHQFVIDGYNENNEFHVNWGWGGSCNGMYLISALNPTGQPYKFNGEQDFLLNFYPANGEEIDPTKWLTLYGDGFTGSYDKENQSIDYNFIITNLSAQTYTGKISLKIVDRNGNIINDLYLLNYPNLKTYYTRQNWGSFQISKEIADNIKPGYRVRIYHQPNGFDEWYPTYKEGAAESIGQEILLCEDTESYTITASGYASLYSENSLIVPAGVEVYTYTYDKNSNALTPGDAITEGDIIPANTGFIIKGNTGTYKFEVTTKGAGAYTSDLSGTISEINKPEGDIYVLAEKSGKVTFYKYTGDKIPAGKVYFIKAE